MKLVQLHIWYVKSASFPAAEPSMKGMIKTLAVLSFASAEARGDTIGLLLDRALELDGNFHG